VLTGITLVKEFSNYCECEVYNSDKGDVPLL
jgi:hypothetical protein